MDDLSLFFQVVDARSDKRYHGTAPEPRPDLPSGHMKGSLNLPFYKLFNPVTKTLASKQVIQEGIIIVIYTCF